MDIFTISKKGLEAVGDALAYILTLLPCWFIAIWGTSTLAVIWIVALAAEMALVHLLKLVFNSTKWGKRPDGGDFAFPSAHTSNSFFGAMWMITAGAFPEDISKIVISAVWFIGAGVVAYSRIQAGRHHLRDVIAGALLGMLIAFLTLQF